MISATEFRQALPSLGLKVDREAADALFAEFDLDGSGEVDYRELHKALQPGNDIELDESLQPGAAGEIETSRANKIALRTDPADAGLFGASSLDPESEVPIVQQLQRVLSKNLARVIDLFREWDEDNSGTISRKEFLRAMPALGLRVSSEVSSELWE
eukprot:470422-Prymnesium_polylepis.1